MFDTPFPPLPDALPAGNERFNLRTLVGLLAFGLLTTLLWRSPFLLPLKLVVVLVHETGHAVAALLTGGEVEEIRVWLDQSGITRFRGGNYTIAASAGYLGSAMTGSLLLWATPRPRLRRALCLTLGGLLLAMTLVYVPLSNPTGFAVGLVAGGSLVFAAVKQFRFLALAVMGLAVMSCLYAVYDFSDYLLGDPHLTDAGLLARHFGLPFLAYPIGIVWSIASLWLMWLGLRAACIEPPPASPVTPNAAPPHPKANA